MFCEFFEINLRELFFAVLVVEFMKRRLKFKTRRFHEKSSIFKKNARSCIEYIKRKGWQAFFCDGRWPSP